MTKLLFGLPQPTSTSSILASTGSVDSPTAGQDGSAEVGTVVMRNLSPASPPARRASAANRLAKIQ
jgi:hypothetical protein